MKLKFIIIILIDIIFNIIMRFDLIFIKLNGLMLICIEIVLFLLTTAIGGFTSNVIFINFNYLLITE